jgi:hypothetical protein
MVRLRCKGVLLGAMALGACDQQVDRGYQGESLLRIEGNVVIPLGLEGRELVPAIAFNSYSEQARRECSPPRTDQWRYLEVAVSGDFPSSFQLDLFDPPPEEALRRYEPGGPLVAAGTFTALTPDHPDAVLMRANSQETYEDWPWGAPGPCEGASATSTGEPPAMAQTTCMVQRVCTLDGDDCLDKTLECKRTGPILFYTQCKLLRSEGDESLLAAGYSANYRLFYFAAPVEAGSVTAERFTNGEGVAGGYHLYRVEPNSDPGPEHQTCGSAAASAGLERYNADHDTEYGFETLGGPVVSAISYEVSEGVRCEVSRELVERGCVQGTASLERIDSDQVISIELGSGGP